MLVIVIEYYQNFAQKYINLLKILDNLFWIALG